VLRSVFGDSSELTVQKSDIKMYTKNFELSVGDEGFVVLGQVTLCTGQIRVWLGGRENSKQLGNLCLAVQTKFDTMPLVKDLVVTGDDRICNEDVHHSIAIKLAKKLQVHVYLSCSLSPHVGMELHALLEALVAYLEPLVQTYDKDIETSAEEGEASTSMTEGSTGHLSGLFAKQQEDMVARDKISSEDCLRWYNMRSRGSGIL
jgi:hypothetical protein